MQIKFVQIKTNDGLELPGLFYVAKKSKKVAIFLHGNGSSSIFYSEKRNQIYAESYASKGISSLYFNNRGAHIIKTFKIKTATGKVKRKSYGMAYEKIKECVYDIDGAVQFLKKSGYQEIFLVGSSTGANKICVYDHYRPNNKIAKYVILGGADDMDIYYELMGKSNFLKMLNIAKIKIKKGLGEKISTELLHYDLVFSYQGFYDIANPDGDYNVFPFLEKIKNIKLSHKPLFGYFKAIKKKTLVMYGELDIYCGGDANRAVKILKSYQPEFNYKVVKGGDHSFNGKQKLAARLIAEWLAKK